MDTYINLDSQSSIKEGIIRKLLLEFGKNRMLALKRYTMHAPC